MTPARSNSTWPARARRSPVRLEVPAAHHAEAFVAAVRASRALHGPWVSPPDSVKAYRAWLETQSGDPSRIAFLIVERESGGLVGSANASGIVRGPFKSCYFGYQAFAPFAGRGLFRAGMALCLDELFGTHDLHRVEANIQPQNERSKQVATSLGFRLEGYSPRYLKIRGRWRDHERFALLAEEWRRSPAPDPKRG
jgi:[ribosomal protein S5]-alanine N-acetyltransferase